MAGFLFPYLADSKGRWKGIIAAILIGGVSSIICAIAPDIKILMLFMFLAGFGFSGFETLAYVYNSEVSGQRYRTFSVVTLAFVFAGTQLITSTLFNSMGTWRKTFLVIIGIPALVSLIPILIWIYETPRWLISKHQYAKAREILNKICHVNNRPEFKARLIGEIEEVSANVTTIFPPRETKDQSADTNIGYLDLFTRPALRKTTLLLLYVWFFRNVTYYGLNYSLPVLGTALYRNFTFAAVSEAIASIIAVKIMLHGKRTKFLNLTAVLVTFSCLIIVFFPIPDDCYGEGSCYQKAFSWLFAMVIVVFSYFIF